jgi:putative ATPase
MQCLPDSLRDRVYYRPTNEGVEKRIRERLEEIKRLKQPAGPQQIKSVPNAKQKPNKKRI